ncbi:hypothetical protein [Bifidobacterium olomucense]|uniref:hypothetical protein n=1 Tax=Bifidobacterium olomucense TaxID=2675324 RepID=UPI001F0F1C83|nr:hypothetical protein [Bifidobacterium sp. DSM 109959]
MTNQSDQPTTSMPTASAHQTSGQPGGQPIAQTSPTTAPIVYPNATAGGSTNSSVSGPAGDLAPGSAPIGQPQPHKKTSKLTIFAIIVDVVFLLSTFIGVNSWSTLVILAVLPLLLSGFSLYTTRKNSKMQGRVLAWVAVGIAVVGLIVGSVNVVRIGAKSAANDAAFKEHEGGLQGV